MKTFKQHIIENKDQHIVHFLKNEVELKSPDGKSLFKGTPALLHKYIKDNGITDVKFTQHDPFEEDNE